MFQSSKAEPAWDIPWPNFSVNQTFVKILVMFSYKIINLNLNLFWISKQGFKHRQYQMGVLLKKWELSFLPITFQVQQTWI